MRQVSVASTLSPDDVKLRERYKQNNAVPNVTRNSSILKHTISTLSTIRKSLSFVDATTVQPIFSVGSSCHIDDICDDDDHIDDDVNYVRVFVSLLHTSYPLRL